MESGDAEFNTSLNGSFVSDDRRAGVYLFGMVKDRDAYDRNDDGFMDLTSMLSRTLGFRGYYKTSAHSKLTAEYHNISEFRRGGDNIDLPPHMAEIAEQVDHNINGGSFRWNYFSPNSRHFVNLYTSAQGIGRDSYYGTGKDPNAYGETKDFTLVAGAQYSYVFEKCLFLPAQFTVGFEYSYNDLNDHSMGFSRTIEQTVRTAGLYLQNEWQSEKVNFVIGGRLDKHNMMDKVIFSPRANLRYSPHENVGLRVSYSSGYRAPQAFDEDLHIDAVNNLEKIAAVAGIDGFIVGPNDLSGSIGKLGQLQDPEMIRLYQQIGSVLKAAGKPVGIYTGGTLNCDHIRAWIDMGYTMFFTGSDCGMVYNGATAMLNDFSDAFRK
jgi:outer membrane receptor for ferrienterochelin and colicins